jgi:hypothetical protein
MNVNHTLTQTPQETERVADRARLRGSWLVARFLGALAVLAMGAVHLQQYAGAYERIPTIGTLFVVNFAAATVIGVALLAPIEHLAGRWSGPAVAMALAAGIALSAGTLVMLLISERTPLFGFQESGYAPTAIAFSKAVEAAAVVLLAVALVARFAPRARHVPPVRW